MSAEEQRLSSSTLVYPDSDGQPMADNTLQFEWISKLKGALEYLFFDDPEVFVAGDLLWYPVEGEPKTRRAPDVMVVFGRPKGYRGSYRQWEEAGIGPQVVIEVLSPSNKTTDMIRKQFFYDRFGVEEYYLLDPEEQELFVWLRQEGQLTLSYVDLPDNRWTSPRLKLTFAVEAGELKAYFPDGELVLPYQDMHRKLEAKAEEERVARVAVEARLAELEAELKRLRGE